MASYSQFLEMSFTEKFNSLLMLTTAVVFLGVLLPWLWSRRKQYALSMQLDEPVAFPIVGCVACIYRMATSSDPMGILQSVVKKFPGIVRLWMGPELMVLVHKPEDVENVMKCRTLSAKPPIAYKMWVDFSGDGILTTIGLDSIWKNHRKVVSYAFCSSTLASYQTIFQRQSLQLLQDLDQFRDQGLVDYETVVCRFVGDYSLETMFDYKARFREGKNDLVIHALEWGLTAIYTRMSKFWYIPDFMYKFCPLRENQERGYKATRELASNIYDVKKKDFDFTKDYKSPNVMEALFEAEYRGAITKQGVLDEIMNVWGASVDTMNQHITVTMLMLAMYKEYQDKVFQEIREYYKDDRDAAVERDHLQHFPYLDMFIKEVLRIFTITVANLRYVTEEFVMKTVSGDVVIPPKTTVIIMMMLSHRDPEVWPNPEVFNPERFTPEEVARRHPWAYYPFTGGPRNCLGQKYAGIIAKTALVYILRKFELHSDWKLKDMPLAYRINVYSPWGYKARFTERKW